ncbi:CPBP family intramembrane glutamic endopeptidase [Clostridium estertheticum]|uniref:CPBP family intramembrane metalloprotease n=1 Tax=Clostridium estertheticum TaxID=238834 RepID=A0A7Y3SZ51_9CLOT|nr:CPBP family intramembrane glutamic endopeptidase [Clostridium estertheticum]NNU78071.1 CPBP family intramembrane metalloprotease [Clostridium estertheticum]WBL49505.1 CPBP family intramembrane metalloprotease [Clostridium estertheticum]
MADRKIKQLSIIKLLLLVFFPAFLILGSYLWALQFRATIPPFLSFMVIIFVVLIPSELGIILIFSKKETGKLNLQSAFIAQEKLSVKEIISISIVLIVFAAIIFTFISPIESNFMFKKIFSKVPEYFKLSDFFKHYGNYSKIIVITSLVLYAIGNGILGPIVEELYFRGLIMPRINRFGKLTPLIITLLFSAYHLFSPWEYITRVIACFPFVHFVYKKKNIYIGMAVHCTLNIVSIVMAIIGLMSNSGLWHRI